jgi:hypothetical protein
MRTPAFFGWGRGAIKGNIRRVGRMIGAVALASQMLVMIVFIATGRRSWKLEYAGGCM